MTTRNGKIARLPFEIREELNHRLLENEPAKTILHWLNGDSTVRHLMEALFEGRPISEQNISEWRQGGYEEWLTYGAYLGNVSDLSENAARVALTGINAEHLLLILTAAFADLLHKQDATDEIAFNRRLIVLQHLTKTALAMRRSEQKDARLQLDRERLEILRHRNPDKSPSSSPPSSETSKSPRSAPGSHQNDSESRHSSFELRHSLPRAPHPYHTKAPEICRPAAPQPAEVRPDGQGSASSSNFYPYESEPSSHETSGGPAVAVTSAAPAPTGPETTNRLD
jgi:hypothetical protein